LVPLLERLQRPVRASEADDDETWVGPEQVLVCRSEGWSGERRLVGSLAAGACPRSQAAGGLGGGRATGGACGTGEIGLGGEFGAERG